MNIFSHLDSKGHPIPDYSWLSDKTKNAPRTTFSDFIEKKIQDLRNTEYDGEVHNFTRDTLANKIGLEKSTLTKIINQSQRTRKRDVILAICLVLKMTERETNLALELYQMASLSHANLRDLIIIQSLYDKITIEALNIILSKHDLPTLNLLRGDEKSETRVYFYSYDSTAFEEEALELEPPRCIDAESSNISLHERYHPEQYYFFGKMIVHSKENPSERYRIEQELGGDYDIYLLTDDGERLLYSEDYLHKKYFNATTCEDVNLENEVSKLREYLSREYSHVHQMCGDTLYYGSRLTAENENGVLVVYGECFNYDAPELCEYYQIEISSFHSIFTISDTSRFMEKYLGEKEWSRLYGPPLAPPHKKFTSMDEITDARWQKQFAGLLDSASDLLVQLRQQKLYLYNVRSWMDIEMLMQTYAVEDAFECIQGDEDAQFMLIPQKEEIIGSDGRPITIEDLWRAAELGIPSIADLCGIRTHYGSLEQFLHIDLLDQLCSFGNI